MKWRSSFFVVAAAAATVVILVFRVNGSIENQEAEGKLSVMHETNRMESKQIE